jgi:hypothetical protein
MYYRAHFDGRGAGLRADDIAAVRSIYPGAPSETPTDDADGDGVSDATDNCPGNDAVLGLANAGQTDTDADGMGDLCDACPLVPAVDGVQSCQPIADSSLKIVEADASLLWRGVVELPADVDVSAVRIVLTAGAGLLVDTANTASGIRRVGRQRRRLLYRSDGATITLKRGRWGLHSIRAMLRGVTLGADAMPVVSASLQVGTSVFATSLSCPPRGGRRFNCRG